MVVSMVQFILEIPDVASIKDKRKVIKSAKDRIFRKFRVSIAEVDLQDSMKFSQLGAALVSNSKTFGEEVMNKIIDFVENEVDGRLQDVSIHSEIF